MLSHEIIKRMYDNKYLKDSIEKYHEDPRRDATGLMFRCVRDICLEQGMPNKEAKHFAQSFVKKKYHEIDFHFNDESYMEIVASIDAYNDVNGIIDYDFDELGGEDDFLIESYKIY